MAGLYPDVPGHRFAYDVDGTVVRYRFPDGTFTVPPASGASATNDEDSTDYVEFGNLNTGHNFFTTGFTTGFYMTFIFPQVRDVLGYFVFAQVQAITIATHRSDIIQTSADTTDGTDGTWTTRVSANFPYSLTPIFPRMRDSIQPIVGATGIKGIRFAIAKDNASGSNNDWYRMFSLHLYGNIVGTNNGLRFWNPTLDQEIDKAHFDYGNTPQGTLISKSFRLKNTSAQQANSTVISAESPAGSDALLAQGMTFSLDGSTWTTSVTVTSLAAGAISPIIQARRSVPALEVPQVRAARIKALVGSWT